MAKSSGGARANPSVRRMGKSLGFSVQSYRGTVGLVRDGYRKTFKDQSKLDSFLGQVFYREKQLGRPPKRYGSSGG